VRMFSNTPRVLCDLGLHAQRTDVIEGSRRRTPTAPRQASPRSLGASRIA
jgi:hypothetical protein